MEIVFAIFVSLYMLLDRTFLSYREGIAKVVEKTYCPAYTQTYMQSITVGSITTMVPQVIQHPERYVIDMCIDNMWRYRSDREFLQ